MDFFASYKYPRAPANGSTEGSRPAATHQVPWQEHGAAKSSSPQPWSSSEGRPWRRGVQSRAPLLQSLCLSYFPTVTSEGFELSNCHGVDANAGVFELVAKACPRLRLFRHEKHHRRYDPYFSDDPNNDREALAIGRMHELRSLTLYYDTLTNEGLMAIVDNCPHLEYLDIRSCGNITMNDALKAKCAGIKTKIYVPHRCNDDKDNCSLGSFQSDFRISVYSSLFMSEYFQQLQKRREEDADYYYDPYYYYLNALDEVHLEEHGRLLGKSGWRYNL